MLEKLTWRHACYGLLITLTLLKAFLSFDYGITGDEWVHVKQSERILEYFKSGFTDKRAATDGIIKKEGDIFLYGNSIDTVCHFFSSQLGVDEYAFRHLVNAILSVLALLFAGLILSEIAGWRAAFFGIVIFIVSPRFFGDSMNNLKDVPFAVTYIGSIYFMMRFLKELPKPSLPVIIGLTLFFASSLSIRIGGLLIIPYVIMFSGIHWLLTLRKDPIARRNIIGSLRPYLVFIPIIAIAGYFLGIILWPYALEAPLSNPFNALKIHSAQPTVIAQLFEGKTILSSELPRYYLAKYIMMTTPELFLAGMVLFTLLLYFLRKEYHMEWVFLVLFISVFPIAYIIYKKANVFGAWRHVTFAYPGFVILAGLGWESLLRLLKKHTYQYVVYGVFGLLSLVPIQWMIVHHPHQTVYFNSLSGGTEKAYGEYELDYYGNSLKKSLDWLVKEKNLKASKDSVIIATNSYRNLSEYFKYLPGVVKCKYVRYYERSNVKWDYAIFNNTYISPSQLKKGIFPPEKVIHTEHIGKAILSSVSERPSKEDLMGYGAMKEGNYLKAIEHYNTYLEADKKNELVYEGLLQCYSQLKLYDEAIKAGLRAIELRENNVNSYVYTGIAYLNQGEFDNAIQLFKKCIKGNPDYAAGYYYLAVSYAQKGEIESALNYVNRAINIDGSMREAYQLAANLYQQKGDNASAQKYLNAIRQ